MSDEVFVRVDNVSKKFCKSLKRSLWYGMCAGVAGFLVRSSLFFVSDMPGGFAHV